MLTSDDAKNLVAQLKEHLPRDLFMRLCRDWQESEFMDALEDESEKTFPDLYG